MSTEYEKIGEIYRKKPQNKLPWWVWVIAIFFLIGIFNDGDKKSTSKPNTTQEARR